MTAPISEADILRPVRKIVRNGYTNDPNRLMNVPATSTQCAFGRGRKSLSKEDEESGGAVIIDRAVAASGEIKNPAHRRASRVRPETIWFASGAILRARDKVTFANGDA